MHLQKWHSLHHGASLSSRSFYGPLTLCVRFTGPLPLPLPLPLPFSNNFLESVPQIAQDSSNKRDVISPSGTATQSRALHPVRTQPQHLTIPLQQPAKMPVEGDTERYFYPWNPHTKTHEQVRSIHNPVVQSAPGIAPIHTFAIEPTHPIVPHWRDVCGQTVEKLDKAGINWVAVECFRRRQQYEKADDIDDDTTIVITVKDLPSMTDDLREVLKEIHELSGISPLRTAITKTNVRY